MIRINIAIGLYPLIGWRINDELIYVVEGASNDTGVLIEWGEKIGEPFNSR